jgi:transposase-like protein
MVLEWTKEVAMASESAEPIERWTAKRARRVGGSILKGETSVAEAARQHGVTVAEVETWREKFLLGAENALRSRPRDEEALKEEQIKKLKQKIGDLVLDNDILREPLKPMEWTHPSFRGMLPIAMIGRHAINGQQEGMTYAGRDCGD